jgi:hypothetical protein
MELLGGRTRHNGAGVAYPVNCSAAPCSGAGKQANNKALREKIILRLHAARCARSWLFANLYRPDCFQSCEQFGQV